MMKPFLSLLLVLLCAGDLLAQPAAPTVTGTTALCTGSATTLTASGGAGATFRWYDVPTGGTQLASGAVYTTQTLGTAGTYHYYVEQLVGTLTSARQDVTLTVSQKPTVSAATSKTIACKGTAVTLSATGATTYSWSPGGAGASITVNPVQTTTYTVVGVSNGCASAPATVSVAIDSVIAPPAVTICPGTATTLTASGSTAYSWSPGGQMGASITVTPAGTTTYTVSSTGSSCPSAAQVTVTVRTGVTGLAIAGPSSVTAGTLVPLTATATQSALTYAWGSSGGNLGLPASDSITVVPTTTTTYTVVATDANACTATATRTVTVAPLPDVSGTTNLCPNSNTTLTASGTGPFTWYDAATGGTLLFTGVSFTTPSLTASTGYWVSGNGGPRKVVSLHVPSLTLSGAAAVPATICAGKTTYLRAAYTDGPVKWYDAPTGGTLVGSAAPGDSLAVTPAVTTTYYAAATPAVQTVDFAYTGAVQTWTVPAGVTSIRVDAYGSRGNNAFSPNQWVGGGGRVQTTLAVTPGQVLSLYVGGENSWNGGGSTTGAQYSSQVSHGGDATDIRIGGTALVNRVVVAGGGGAASASNPPTYLVGSATGGGGGLVGQPGGRSLYSQIYGEPASGGGGQSGGGGATCLGNRCGASGGFGYGGGSNAYQAGSDIGGSGGGGWYGGGAGSSYTGGGGGSSYTNPQLCQNTVHTQGTWGGLGSISISWGTGCAAAARVPVTVTVNPSTQFATDLAPIQFACQGGTLALSATATNGSGYQWYKSGTAIAGATSTSYSIPAVAAADSGRYSLVATYALGCNDTTASQIRTVPKPAVRFGTDTLTCTGGAVLLPKTTLSGGIFPYTFSYTVNGGTAQTVVDSGLRARYVRVKQNKAGANLNLAEIQVFDAYSGLNVALNKPATATSTLSGFPVANINDGNLTNFWHNNTGDTTEYVEIDLGAPGYLLSSVRITNRPDCCQDRSSNLQLLFRNDAGVLVRSRQIDAYQGQNTGYTTVYAADSSTQTFPALPSNAAASWQYTVINITSAGQGCSGPVPVSRTYTVNATAAITTEPAALTTVCAGGAVSLATAATGATGYQWRKGSTAVAGATGPTYALTAALADSGTYTVIASGAGGCNDTSASAVIRINGVPVPAILTTADSLCVGSAVPGVQLAATGIKPPFSYAYKIDGGATQTATDSGVRARYVRITQNAADWTNLAEIAVIRSGAGTNVALNKTATASSSASGFPPSMAVDGNAGNYWHSGTSNSGEYIEIDLGAVYPLRQVRITNRQDCCQARASNLQLTLKDSAGMSVLSRQIDAYQGQNTAYTYVYDSLSAPIVLAVPSSFTAAPGTRQYTVVSVTSAAGCASAAPVSRTVRVLARPQITVAPAASTVVCTGAPLTLAVTASNAGSYGWRQNGTVISGATGAVYTDSLVAFADSGIYTAIAMSGVAGCNDTSAAASVTVKPGPVLAVDTTSLVCEGMPAAFRLRASGAGYPFQIGYSLNGGATQTLTTTKAPKVRYVRIKQTLGSTMRMAKVRIYAGGVDVARNAPVSGYGNPNSALTSTTNNTVWVSYGNQSMRWAEVDLGAPGYDVDSVRILKVANFGAGLTNLQLILKGVDGAELYNAGINAYQGSSIADSPSFAVPGLNPTDAEVVVSTALPARHTLRPVTVSSANGCVTTLTDSTSMTVNPKPRITVQPATSLTLCAAAPLTLTTTAPVATAFQWYKNGTAIAGATGAVYARPAAAVSDSGTYRLITATAAGCTDTSTVSTVAVSPVASGTLTGTTALCQGAPVPNLVFAGIGAAAPYTFTYTLNGVTQSVTGSTPPKVRYIRIRQTLSDYLNLAEVQAIETGTGTNVALNKTVTSTPTAPTFPATQVNDGILSNYYHSNLNTDSEYVQIDLGTGGYNLSELRIINRADCCQDRAAALEVTYKDTTGVVLNTTTVNAYQGVNSQYTAAFPVVLLGSIATLPVPTATAGSFKYKLVSVSGIGGCGTPPTDSATVTVAAKASITTQPVATQFVCRPNPLVLAAGVSNAVGYQWRKGTTPVTGAVAAGYTKANVVIGDAGTYRLIALGANGCNDTSATTVVTIGSLAGFLGTDTGTTTLNHTDGLAYTYADVYCQPIAAIADAAGGNVLGMTQATLSYDSSVKIYSGAPYLQRHVDLAPASNGPATVKLYATQDDFDAFNAYVSSHGNLWSKLPTGPSDAAGIAHLTVTQFHGLPSAGTTGPGGQYLASGKQVIPAAAITTAWNGSYWTLSFPVTGFSGFFITSGTGTALTASLLDVGARNAGAHNIVSWTSAAEERGDYYDVERSTDGRQFARIGTVEGVAPKGTGYTFTDEHPAPGLNYYRLLLGSAGGASAYSKVVTAQVSTNDGFAVAAHPNPARDLLTVRIDGVISGDGHLTLTDAAGRVVRTVAVTGGMQSLNLSDVAAGMYLLRYTDALRSISLKVTRE